MAWSIGVFGKVIGTLDGSRDVLAAVDSVAGSSCSSFEEGNIFLIDSLETFLIKSHSLKRMIVSSRFFATH